MSTIRKIAYLRYSVYSAVFTALIFIATVLIVVATPATRGFFNLGESMVYTTALLTLDPWISFLAGGLGSALADLYLGYGHYAPATFIIKSFEGLLVVFLYRLFRRIKWKKLFIILFSIVLSTLVLVYGLLLYSGVTFIEVLGNTIEVYVPAYFWTVLAVTILLTIEYIGLKYDPDTGLKILAVLIAGFEMVTGYYLYQAYFLGYGIVATTEIPINIGQAVIGLTIALPLTETLKKMGIDLGV